MKIDRLHREFPLYLMVIPGFIINVIFNYAPMVGIVMAFQKYVPARGILRSTWVGLANFRYIFNMHDFESVLFNTVFIASMKIAAGLTIPVFFALLLNEVRNHALKRSIQTLVYLPHFLSWVIVAGILVDILSPSYGIVNKIIKFVGLQPIFFFGDADVFPYTMVVTDVWKGFGYGTIVYLAALTGISPEYYEAAIVDGANRWQQTLHITLPGIKPIVVLMTALSIGGILNAGFDQIINLYSPSVYRTGDIIDALIYRIGIQEAQFSVSTALGLFRSLIATILLVISYFMADKVAHYRIF